jgi:hypothetical protein
MPRDHRHNQCQRARRRQLTLARPRQRAEQWVQGQREADFLRAVERKRALTGRPRRSVRQRVKRTNKEAEFTWVRACLFGKPDFFGPFAPTGQQEGEYRIIFGEPQIRIFGHLHEAIAPNIKKKWGHKPAANDKLHCGSRVRTLGQQPNQNRKQAGIFSNKEGH